MARDRARVSHKRCTRITILYNIKRAVRCQGTVTLSRVRSSVELPEVLTPKVSLVMTFSFTTKAINVATRDRLSYVILTIRYTGRLTIKFRLRLTWLRCCANAPSARFGYFVGPAWRWRWLPMSDVLGGTNETSPIGTVVRSTHRVQALRQCKEKVRAA